MERVRFKLFFGKKGFWQTIRRLRGKRSREIRSELLKALTGEGILWLTRVSSCVKVWQNSQRLANRCNYSVIQEGRSQAMCKLQRDITLQFARKSLPQMPSEEMLRNSAIKAEDGQ